MFPSIIPKELVQLIETTPDEIEIIDVRSLSEFDACHVVWAKHIPLHIIPLRMNEIDSNKRTIFICQSGARSAQACMFFLQNNKNATNLHGGTSSFAAQFPDKVSR